MPLVYSLLFFFGYLIHINDSTIPSVDAKHEFNQNAANQYDLDLPKSKGEYIARASDCIACHTAKDGYSYAGGLPLTISFGTIYSTNITPDKQTGIGNYSLEEFSNAVRKGIRRDGESLYPIMPYTAYRNMTDADIRFLYIFL